MAAGVIAWDIETVPDLKGFAFAAVAKSARQRRLREPAVTEASFTRHVSLVG